MGRMIYLSKEMIESIDQRTLADESFRDALERILGIPKRPNVKPGRRAGPGRPLKYRIKELKVGQTLIFSNTEHKKSSVYSHVCKLNQLKGCLFRMYDSGPNFIVMRIA